MSHSLWRYAADTLSKKFATFYASVERLDEDKSREEIP